MPYRKAAPLLGLTDTALYNFIRSGSIPACRVGGKRGRWFVELAAVREQLEKLMMKNLSDETKDDGFLYPKIRRIGSDL